jgi:hypothetical protein
MPDAGHPSLLSGEWTVQQLLTMGTSNGLLGGLWECMCSALSFCPAAADGTST